MIITKNKNNLNNNKKIINLINNPPIKKNKSNYT